MSAMLDVLVLGDDAPSLCAAAAAAQSGVATGLLMSGAPAPAGVSISDIPNFVWRRLDLQEFGLRLAPASARVTLLADGAATSFASEDETASALRERSTDSADLWPAFAEEMRALALQNSFVNGDDEGGLLARLADLRSAAAIADLAGPASGAIDDVFGDAELRAHLRAHALSPFGLGGEEAGSAAAMPQFFSEEAWPVRPAGGVRKLLKTLKDVCEKQGVKILSGEISTIAPDGARANALMIGEEKIRTRRIFLASPDAARMAGYRREGFSLRSAGGARARLALKVRKKTPPAAGDETALFQIVDDADNLQAARDAALDGVLPESLPLGFEFADRDEIVAVSAYIPARLRDEEGWRDWTGQDRQRLANIMIDRLASRLPDLKDEIVRKELRLEVDEPRADLFERARNIWLQAKAHGAVAEAVKLMDRALADG